jgi:hypothetical protein
MLERESKTMTNPIGSCTFSIVDGVATRPQNIPYYTLLPAREEFPNYIVGTSYRHTKPTDWCLLPKNTLELEVIKHTDKLHVFWFGDANLKRHTFCNKNAIPVALCVSLDGGKNWEIITDWTSQVTYLNSFYKPYMKEQTIAAANLKKKVYEERAKERSEKFKQEAKELGLTQKELRQIKHEERKTQKVVKKEAALTELEVFHLQQRLKFSTALRKIESNLEALLDVANSESDIDTDRFAIKIKKANKIAAELSDLVKKINVNRNKKKDSK